MKQIAIAMRLVMASAGVAAGPALARPMPVAVYARPASPMPGPGYVWMSHPRYGWGWR